MRRDHVLQFVLEAAQTPDFQGVTAQAVADALSIWRNDAAVELNKLVAEGKLRRVGKKNVRFFPASEETADIRPEPAVQEEPPQAEEETGQYRAFSGLVGADGSLKYQLRVAMAAVAYPPNGLNMLITGSTGSGKSHFARTIWEYAKETKALCGAHAPIPFVEFNCAEYADNPQLLLSHLFGYKKGAFTGALEDKPGLVEQANGGILFLDEIHGLSSTGQEMFFSLLDTGVFRRVGDNTPRTSRFMLIGATTKPLTDLLETFLRRMPVLISMPTLSDRPMKERLELVEHFYAEEAAHIGHTLRIQKGALNSILDYSRHSNLGVLKNLVQLSCAKAFLRENVAGNRTGEIAVTFSDLSFQTYNVSAETEKYAHGDLHFAEDLVVPNQRIQSSAADVASFVDVYDFVESRLSGEQEQHHDAGNLQQIIAAEIDNYYVDMERALQAPDVDRSLLDSVLFPGSIGICSEFLSRASYALNHVYPSIAATLLAMHLSQYVSRMRSEQPAFPLSVRGGLQGYGAELDFLRENRQWLAQAIKVHISTDEMNCLAVLLRQAGKKREKPPVWLTLASGSDGVAAGMARHLNAVYDTNHVHWVDSTRGGSLFQSLCDHIATFHGEAGNLIFTDMKVLTTLEPELTKATGHSHPGAASAARGEPPDAASVAAGPQCAARPDHRGLFPADESSVPDLRPRSARAAGKVRGADAGKGHSVDLHHRHRQRPHHSGDPAEAACLYPAPARRRGQRARQRGKAGRAVRKLPAARGRHGGAEHPRRAVHYGGPRVQPGGHHGHRLHRGRLGHGHQADALRAGGGFRRRDDQPAGAEPALYRAPC